MNERLANRTVMIVPCSGTGKVYGLLSREATYAALEQLGAAASTLCLALVVTGDVAAREAVRRQPCITVDGCAKACAYQNLRFAGGTVAYASRVLDTCKRHRGVHAGTPGELSEAGWEMADELAAELVTVARRLSAIEEG